MALHDGQEEFAPMVGTCSLFCCADLVNEYAQFGANFDKPKTVSAKLVGPGVRATEHSSGWIPIGRSARGRDFLCLDLDPAAGGCVGQIIKVAIDFDDRPLVASSFTNLLSVYFEGVQLREIKDDEDRNIDE